MSTVTIKVLDWRLAEAKQELEKLLRKANKYGCDFAWSQGATIGERRKVTDWDGRERVVGEVYVELHITGDIPVVGPYEFLAHVELHEGGNLVDARPGVKDLDEKFRHTNGYCDHCRTLRGRKDIFVVRNTETGAQLQVGRACLKDFLGADPANVLRRFSYFASALELEELVAHGKPSLGASLEGVLALSAVCIRLFGWCSRSQAGTSETLVPTSSYVCRILFPPMRATREDSKFRAQVLDSINAGDYEVAANVMTWVRDELKGDSEYAHNLKVLFGSDVIHDSKRLGLIISAVASYHRAKERDLKLAKNREEAAKSEFLGVVGQRLRGVSVTLREQRVIGSNEWGDRVLVKLSDDAGNLITWITSKGSGHNVGERLALTATVKDHNEFRGVRETVVTRAKLEAA